MFYDKLNESSLLSYQENRCFISASFNFPNQLIFIFLMLRYILRLYFLELSIFPKPLIPIRVISLLKTIYVLTNITKSI